MISFRSFLLGWVLLVSVVISLVVHANTVPAPDILDFLPALVSGRIRPPTNLVVWEIFLRPGQLTIEWQDNSGNEEGFIVERSPTAGGEFERVATLAANTAGYIDSGITPGVSYTYRAKAYRGKKESAYSNEYSAICTTQPPPAAPSNLRANPISSTSIVLIWQDNSDNEWNFEVFRSTSPDTGWGTIGIAKVNANITTYTDPNLTPGQTYYYKVRARNNPFPTISDFSNLASATTQELINPVLSGPSTVTQYFNLTWTYSWPQPWRADDHYVLEFSHTSPTLGFQTMATYANGDRSSPKSEEILPDRTDIGITTYYRVRAYCNGVQYTSNVLAISTPYISIGVYPTYDNLINDSSIDSSVRNTVYAGGDLQTGTFYVSLPMTGNSYVTSASLLRFDYYGGWPLSTFIAGRTIQSAKLILTPKNVPLPGTSYLLQLLKQDWNPALVTYANCPTMWGTPVTTMLPPTTAETPWQIDVKAHVQAWANVTDNYGFILRDASVVHPGYTAARYFDIYSLETAIYYSQLPQLYLEIH